MENQDLTLDEIRERYDASAEIYQQRYLGLKGEYYHRFEDSIFLDYIAADGKRILDLGTGRGRLALLLGERAKEVIGIDLSSEMIRHANDAANGRPNVRFEVADASRLRFENGYFDVVASMGMFPYVREPQPFFVEINRVLATGGTFVFSIANADEWDLSSRAYARARGMLGRLRGEPPRAFEESRLIPHTVAELETALAETGFELVDRRSTFFFVPSRVFYVAGRRGLRSVQGAAAIANDMLGRFRLTRDHGKVAILHARKHRAIEP